MDQTKKNDFVTFSLVLGIISIVLAVLLGWFFILPVGVGSMAMILARLSKGTTPMEKQATIGFWLGFSAIILSFVITIAITAFLIMNASALEVFSTEFMESFTREFMNGYNSAYYGGY